mgnify:CR=1 FL=1
MSQPPQPEEFGLGMKLLGAATAAAATFGGWLFKSIHGRIKDVEDNMKTKADESDVVRVKDHIGKIFDQMREDRIVIMRGQRELGEAMHKIHVDLLDKISGRK